MGRLPPRHPKKVLGRHPVNYRTLILASLVVLAGVPMWNMYFHGPMDAWGREGEAAQKKCADSIGEKLPDRKAISGPYSLILEEDEGDPLAGITEDSFRGLGRALRLHRFTRVSSHRWDDRTFIFVGLTALPLPIPPPKEMPAERCWWQPFTMGATELTSKVFDETKRVKGKATRIEIPGHRFMLYRGVNIRCIFPVDVGKSGDGGFIIYQPSGKLCAACPDFPEEKIIIHEERPQAFFGQLVPTPMHEFSVCPPVLSSKPNSTAIKQWLDYHDTLLSRRGPGDQNFKATRTRPYFFIYTVIQDPAIEAVLKPYVDRGQMSVVDWSPAEDFPGGDWNLATQLNDCILRAKAKANFTFQFDFEEYLYIKPPYGVKDLVRILESNGSASLGNWHWKADGCRKPDDEEVGQPWLIEYFVAPSLSPTGGNQATSWKGHRKWVINNRALFQWVGTYVIKPDNGETALVDPLDLGYFNDYSGITRYGKEGRSFFCGSRPSAVYGVPPYTNISSTARAFTRALRIASKSPLLSGKMTVNL